MKRKHRPHLTYRVVYDARFDPPWLVTKQSEIVAKFDTENEAKRQANLLNRRDLVRRGF